mgnify:CR=1 FL=1
MFNRLSDTINRVFIGIVLLFLLAGSAPLPVPKLDQVYRYTNEIEFNFIAWVVDAAWLKLEQAALGSPHYMDRAARKKAVMDYLRQTEEVLQLEYAIDQLYANPDVEDPEEASAELQARLETLYAAQREVAPFAESALEAQVSAALAEASLTSGGQPLPQPLYHISPLPMALIISPRETIRQDRNISLLADFPVDEQDSLEQKIKAELDFSALVVPVGGIGIYPTMGMRSTNLSWIVDTMAHEWMHNYLTWHPLGANYMTSPELRTMNETVASIVGTEIGRMALEEYYPEMIVRERPRLHLLSLSEGPLGPEQFPPPFDYRAEMHETRLRADELLAEGKIAEAEAYMEERRQLMWAHGYTIRKLNQAYFAFYGAYADVPGGAAGADPVGPAVRKLREQSDSLADFVHTVMWMDSFEELQEVVGGGQE